MSGLEFLSVFILIFGAILWLQGMRAKEIARENGRRACEKFSVSFLDDSVVIKKIRIRRNPQGQLVMARLFQFEFATDGSRRYGGVILMLGMKIVDVMLDPYAEYHQS